jgi:glycosyltransferase involved in cell wall biosynthesis
MLIDPPVITAIIPTYRRSQLLHRAIRSVLSQTYPHFQIHVCDNASGDETAALVAEIARDDPRVHYHCHAENIGPSANFLFGMRQVQTPYFAFLSDDDCFLPTFFETAMEGFAQHPDAIFSSGGVINVYEENGKIISSSSSEGYFRPPEGLLEYASGTCPPILGTVFRSDVLTHAIFIDPDILHWDVDYMCRVTARFPFVVSRRPCTVLMHHTQQSSRQQVPDLWLESYVVVRDRIRQEAAIPDAAQRRFERLLAIMLHRAVWYGGLNAILAGDFARARWSARVLRTQFHMWQKALVVGTFAALSARSVPLHRAIGGMVALAKRLLYRVHPESPQRERTHAR